MKYLGVVCQDQRTNATSMGSYTNAIIIVNHTIQHNEAIEVNCDVLAILLSKHDIYRSKNKQD